MVVYGLFTEPSVGASAHSVNIWPQLFLHWYVCAEEMQICCACLSSEIMDVEMHFRYFWISASRYDNLVCNLQPITSHQCDSMPLYINNRLTWSFSFWVSQQVVGASYKQLSSTVSLIVLENCKALQDPIYSFVPLHFFQTFRHFQRQWKCLMIKWTKHICRTQSLLHVVTFVERCV